MSFADEALKSIRKFVEDIKLSPTGADFKSDSARRTYRRFHSLLLWELVVDREGQDPTVRLYFRESLSDLATSYFLNFAGIYKTSRLSARGSIENIFRVLAASAQVDVLSISNIPNLVDACRAKWANTTNRVEVLNSLYVNYGELCNTVHSVAIDYMSLRIPFEKIVEQDRDLFLDNIAYFDRIFKTIGEALFLSFHSQLSHIDYKNADYIRDSVSAEIKRAVSDTI